MALPISEIYLDVTSWAGDLLLLFLPDAAERALVRLRKAAAAGGGAAPAEEAKKEEKVEEKEESDEVSVSHQKKLNHLVLRQSSTNGQCTWFVCFLALKEFLSSLAQQL